MSRAVKIIVTLVTACLLCKQMEAATPVPKVYHECLFKIAGFQFGITETDRVVDGEFRQKIVPGKQLLCDVGPVVFVIPLSLSQFIVAILIGMSSFLILGFQMRRKWLLQRRQDN